MKEPNLGDIQILDPMWSRYLHLISEVSIPYQWEVLNDRVEDAAPSHCIRNFRICAGDEQGEFYGMVFQDSDLYKWLETVAYAIENKTGEKYEEQADEIIDLLGRAQQSDGYLDTYFIINGLEKRFTNLREAHELYCAGHLFEAAAAYSHATGKRKILEIACRYADLLCRTFGTENGKIHGYPGHQEVEIGLERLYGETGEEKYLSLARYFLTERGKYPHYFEEEKKKNGGQTIFRELDSCDWAYYQADVPPTEQKNAEGHAVRAMYMFSAMASMAELEKDPIFESACDRLWDSVVKRRMFITGSVGSSGCLERFTTDYDLPNDRNYSESCASVGLMMFARRMASLKQDASYCDIMELALYNTVLSGISREGDRYFYVNPLEVWPSNCLPNTSMQHVKPVRQKWFDVACCPTNISRTLASVGRYIYGLDKDSVYLNLLISSDADFTVEEGGRIHIHCLSDAVNTGKVKIFLSSQRGKNPILKIRLPWWAEHIAVTQNGEEIHQPLIDRHYLCIRPVSEKDEIELSFTVRNRWISANPNVREDIGKTALMRGPYVYCLEEEDNGKQLASLYVEPGTEVREEMNDGEELPRLVFPGKKVRTWNDDRLYGETESTFEDVELCAVPYFTWGNRNPGEMIVWLHKQFRV